MAQTIIQLQKHHLISVGLENISCAMPQNNELSPSTCPKAQGDVFKMQNVFSQNLWDIQFITFYKQREAARLWFIKLWVE